MATLPRPILETTYFFEQLGRARRSVLLLDFESTIARIADAGPRFPYPTANELLDCIAMTTKTRVVVTTGLQAQELRRYVLPAGAEVHVREMGARLAELAFDAPVAYLTGEPHSVTPVGGQTRLWVRPEYYLGRAKPVLAPAEELVQFLADWLRACAGEVC
jgi:hypothetical protein